MKTFLVFYIQCFFLLFNFTVNVLISPLISGPYPITNKPTIRSHLPLLAAFLSRHFKHLPTNFSLSYAEIHLSLYLLGMWWMQKVA